MKPLVECVPNFSFADDPALLEGFVHRVHEGGGHVLDASSDTDHQRSVVSFVALPERVVDIAAAMIELARERIDLTRHVGVHPRIGACDVFPLIALDGVLEAECVALAHQLGHRVGTLSIPVYFYGKAAFSRARERLADVRRAGFEALARDLSQPDPDASLLPDVGPRRLHPSAGAVAIGVRPILIAFNILLESAELATARAIASTIRESSGGLEGIRALGLALESKGITQVSVNVCDHGKTGLLTLFERVEAEAHRHGVVIRESELIGLAPRAALDAEIASRVRLPGFEATRHVLEDNLKKRLGS